MTIFQGIEHVGIYSPDTSRLAAWYTKNLDMKIIADKDGVYCLLMANGSMIEMLPGKEASVCSGRPEVHDSGIRHVALSVESRDFSEAVHRLNDFGVETIGTTPRQFPEGLATFHFRDPDGNILHLISRPNRLSLASKPNLSDAPKNVVIQGIEHTCIQANEKETLRQWYIDVLGFQLIVNDDGHGTAFILAPDGRSIVEFIQANRNIGMESSQAQGIRYLAVSVAPEDVAHAANRLKAEGVEILKDYAELPGGIHQFCFRDPEGNVIYLMGRPKPLAN